VRAGKRIITLHLLVAANGRLTQDRTDKMALSLMA